MSAGVCRSASKRATRPGAESGGTTATRAALAERLTGPSAAKGTDRRSAALGETFNYLLVYDAGSGAGHTVVLSDTVPAATPVLGATGSKGPAPAVNGEKAAFALSLSDCGA